MKQFTIIIILMFLNLQELIAQKFGKIELEDFEVELNEKDSLADAIYLINKEYVEYTYRGEDLVVTYRVHKRIKILKEGGEKYANHSFGLWGRPSYKEGLVGLKARSYNLEKGKVIETILAKDQIYDEETSEDYRQRKFAIPNVKVGTIIDLVYEKRTPFTRSVRRFFFQKEIPVKFAEYIVNVPIPFEMTPIPTGHIPLERETAGYSGTVFNGTKYTFTAKDIPALKDDEYVLNIKDYRSSLKYEISRVDWRDGVKEYSSSWNQIARKLEESSDFGEEIKRKLKSLDLQVINAKKLEGKDQIKFLYDYVRENYTWNGEYGIYTENIKKAVENRSGNIAEINLLLCNLLIKAGHDARPALVKRRSDGLQNQNYPGITDFNYVLVEVIFNNEVILLDASDKLMPMGILPIEAISNNYLAVEPNSGIIKPFVNPNSFQKLLAISYELDLDEEALVGKGKIRYFNIASVEERKDNAVVKEEIDESEEDEEDIDDLKENTTRITSIENESDIEKPLTYNIEEHLYNEVKFIEDKIIIDACLDAPYDENPFTEDTREYPIFYPYKINITRALQIKIPESYSLESSPEALAVRIGENDGNYIYDCKVVNNTILLTSTLSIKNDIILPQQYSSIKEFYDLIVAKNKEKIILVKK